MAECRMQRRGVLGDRTESHETETIEKAVKVGRKILKDNSLWDWAEIYNDGGQLVSMLSRDRGRIVNKKFKRS